MKKFVSQIIPTEVRHEWIEVEQKSGDTGWDGVAVILAKKRRFVGMQWRLH